MGDFFDDLNQDVSPQEPEPLDPSTDIKDIERGDDLCIDEYDLKRNVGNRIAKCAARLPIRLGKANHLKLFVHHDGYHRIDFGKLREKEKTKIIIDGVKIRFRPEQVDETFDILWGHFSQWNTLSTPFAKIIVNKSSQIVVSEKDTSLIDQILIEGDWKYATIVFSGITDPDPIPAFFSNHDIVTWLTFLKSVIPVYLVCEADMPDTPVPVEFPGSELKNEIVPKNYKITEWLGLYRYVGGSREIWLCPERIKDTAQRLKIPFEHLFAIVYIHELGHAALDSTIDLDKEKNVDGTLVLKVTGERKGYSSRFEYVMEESLANMIMLQYMEWYSEIKEDESLWESAESFVKKQRPAYSYGLTQLKADVDWLLWRNNRYHVDASKESKWLEVFESIMNPQKRNKRVNASYNNLFKKTCPR